MMLNYKEEASSKHVKVFGALMSLPSYEHIDPRQQAESTAAASRLHDVVVAASKVAHHKSLNERDQDGLVWARSLLANAATTEVVFRSPDAKNLSNPGAMICAIRKAATTGSDSDTDDREIQATLNRMSKAIELAVEGKLSEDVVPAMHDLETLFSLVSRMSLSHEVQHTNQQSQLTSL